VALRHGAGWLLHCGDSYFHHDEMQPEPSRPWALSVFQRLCVDDASRRRNQERLRQLAQSHGDQVQLFCSHDRCEFEAARDGSTG
jgi:hypothetical protein